ncbi:MAG: hypothetical protein KKA67_10855 [Spirochaetes bacterium]|nr:hypothetical protein [Spirochaetota bacterium]MBU1079101.1 hypothetical protein [Spirochaetota bacterium]
MNQDRVKELLLGIEECKTEFSVVFTGKKSHVVNGLYKPLTREILIHNKNFENEGQLVYTAIHEYAHHLHCERGAFVPGARAHTNEFWSIFHDLLEKAERQGTYENSFATDPEFVDMTSRIKALMPENGRLMLDLGRLIVEAEALCRKRFVRFEDYLDRAIGVPRTSAGAAMKAYGYQVPADIGWDAMKVVSGIKNPESRSAAIDAFKSGKSPESVKALIKQEKPSDDPKFRLDKERERLERTIRTLQERLTMVESEIAKYGEE